MVGSQEMDGMPVSVIWDDEEHSIVRYILEGQWQWHEFHPLIDEAAAMTRTVSHRVDTVADLGRSGPLPVRNAFPTLKHLAAMTPPNAMEGLFVVIGGSTFVQALGATFKRIYPQMGAPVYFVNTLEEARILIATHRARRT
jgi:hypothetical protein